MSDPTDPEAGSRTAVAYVCPMCPEVRKPGPGACPSCGMALEPEMPVATTRTEYTCPMHPEIVRSQPGSCPICGMALEPRTISGAPEENPELRDMSVRFWIGVVLTMPLLAIAMGSMIWPQRTHAGPGRPAAPVARIRARDSSRSVVRSAVFSTLLDVLW